MKLLVLVVCSFIFLSSAIHLQGTPQITTEINHPAYELTKYYELDFCAVVYYNVCDKSLQMGFRSDLSVPEISVSSAICIYL